VAGQANHVNSGIRVEVDRIDSTEWEQCLGLFEDANLYQTWSYGAVRWGQRKLSHLVLRRDGEVVAMAQLRIVRPGKLKFGIAYLRWGPLCHRKGCDLESVSVHAIANALYEEYVRKRGLFLRILPNAFLNTPRAELFRSAFSAFQTEPFAAGDTYRTFLLDLEPPLDVLRKNLDQKWRNQLNRAEKNGLVITETTEAEGFGVMIELFNEMWARKRFRQTSSLAEFSSIQKTLPASQQMKVFLCQHEAVPVAGLIATGLGDSGIYLFGATSNRALKTKGSYLLQWRVIQWLKESGIRHYNLGGINPEANPGVFHFKRGLSGKDLRYMEPLVACDSLASKVGIPVADFMRRGMRKLVARRSSL